MSSIIPPEITAILKATGRDLPGWSQVPFRYRHVCFETVRQTRAIGAVGKFRDSWVDGCGLVQYSCHCLILAGGVGVGKSTALYALLRALLIETRDDPATKIAFYEFPRLSQLLLDREQCPATLEACREADVLIIDDLGAGFTKHGGFVASCVEEIFIHREAHQYPVVAATNLTPLRFRQLFGERIYDRIRGEWGSWLNVDGPSLRQKRRPSR